jgi:hypothetical protein
MDVDLGPPCAHMAWEQAFAPACSKPSARLFFAPCWVTTLGIWLSSHLGCAAFIDLAEVAMHNPMEQA